MLIKNTSETKRRKIRRISVIEMEKTREFVRIKCPKCEGEGIVWVASHDEHAVSHNFYDEKDCPDCNGLGFIYKEMERI